MANGTKAVKTLVGGDKAMFILEPGVLFQRKTNLPINWTKVRIGLIGSFTNTASDNSTPNAETLSTQSNLLNVPIVGMSNGVGYPGTAGNKCVGVRSAYDAEYGSSSETKLALNGSSNWQSESTPGQVLMGDGANEFSASPNLGTWHKWAVNNPTATSSCMFWFVLELNVETTGSLLATWWHSNLTPLSNASDATLMGLLTNPTSYSGYATNSGRANASTIAWWNAAPVACSYFFVRFPYLLNRLRIMNMNIIDASFYL